jgi:mRNA interferase RelE/StbE
MPEKNWHAELSKDCVKYLKRLKKDTSNKILDGIEEPEIIANPLSHRQVRPLTGKLKGFYRLRIGNFRVIFELDKSNRRIGVHVIVPRGNAD